MNYVIQCRFREFLIQLCKKNVFVLGPGRNITTMCRKIAFLGVRAEILLTWDQGVPGFLCRAIFGVREEILIFRRNIHLCLVASQKRYRSQNPRRKQKRERKEKKGERE